MPTDYERQREANIAANKALLENLGLGKPSKAPVPVARPAPKPKAPKKRKAPPTEEDASKQDGESKEPRIEGVRRSGRNTGKTIDYKAEQDRSVQEQLKRWGSSDNTDDGEKTDRDVRKAGRSAGTGGDGGKRQYDPKTFGHIPGVEVGTWWMMRSECSADAIHAPYVAGISGSGQVGAYSVALSGGYEDDVDLGYAFTYTGAGGRDLKGTKQNPKNLRTAPQSSDQTFENAGNKALLVSSQTGKPVRVIRGFKLHSQYAPKEGYRYDGLYKVEKAWLATGLNDKGFKVCKFAFKRLDGQPPIPTRSETSASVADSDEDAEDQADANSDGSDEGAQITDGENVEEKAGEV